MENNFDSAKTLVERSQELDQAAIEVKNALRPQNVFRVTLDLSKARDKDTPYIINKAFKSIYVESSTDPNNSIYMRPTTDSSEQDFFSLSYKDSWSVSSVVPKAFFHWEQQSGSVTLVFFTDAEFRSGSQISKVAGDLNVTPTDGSLASGPFLVTLLANTAAAIVPFDSLRTLALIQNKTGADLFVGTDNSVNATSNEGLTIPNGGFIEWRNKAALWGFSVSGGKVSRIEERK